MTVFNTELTYGSVAKFFHWTIFILVALMLTGGFFLEDVPEAWQRTAYNGHKLIGLTILTLMLLRALWALINTKPTLPRDTKPWEKVAEHVVHGLLYVLLIAMPLAGWIGATAGGRPPKLGDIALALPVAENKALKEWAFGWHETIAFMLIALLCLHVGAALYHHFFKRDDVLRRMLPKGWL